MYLDSGYNETDVNCSGIDATTVGQTQHEDQQQQLQQQQHERQQHRRKQEVQKQQEEVCNTEHQKWLNEMRSPCYVDNVEGHNNFVASSLGVGGLLNCPRHVDTFEGHDRAAVIPVGVGRGIRDVPATQQVLQVLSPTWGTLTQQHPQQWEQQFQLSPMKVVSAAPTLPDKLPQVSSVTGVEQRALMNMPSLPLHIAGCVASDGGVTVELPREQRLEQWAMMKMPSLPFHNVVGFYELMIAGHRLRRCILTLHILLCLNRIECHCPILRIVENKL